MTIEELDFIGSMNMCDEISNEAYKKIVCHCEEQEPCEDAISRQAVLDRIRESIETYHNQYTTDMLNMWGLFTQFIKEMPSVTPQPKIGHWIPVSERLPEADEYIGDVARYYLVQNEYGDMLVARYTHSGYWEQIYQLKPIGDEIVAWMPLPEPHVPDTNIGNISEKPIGSEPQESGGTDADSN